MKYCESFSMHFLRLLDINRLYSVLSMIRSSSVHIRYGQQDLMLHLHRWCNLLSTLSTITSWHEKNIHHHHFTGMWGKFSHWHLPLQLERIMHDQMEIKYNTNTIQFYLSSCLLNCHLWYFICSLMFDNAPVINMGVFHQRQLYNLIPFVTPRTALPTNTVTNAFIFLLTISSVGVGADSGWWVRGNKSQRPGGSDL